MSLRQRRTAKELPKLWPPSILLEKPKLPGGKSRDPCRVADEAIDWILKHHQPAPLPEDVKRELRKIVTAADQDENLRRGIRGSR